MLVVGLIPADLPLCDFFSNSSCRGKGEIRGEITLNLTIPANNDTWRQFGLRFFDGLEESSIGIASSIPALDNMVKQFPYQLLVVCTAKGLIRVSK
jgi:hypothetical protein